MRIPGGAVRRRVYVQHATRSTIRRSAWRRPRRAARAARDRPQGARLSVTSGQVAIVEHTLHPRALAAPVHRHSREDELPIVLTDRMGAMLGQDAWASHGALEAAPPS